MSNVSLPECLACTIVIEKKKGYVITWYRSPSQNQYEFEPFLSSLENLQGNTRNQDPDFTILHDDFNVRSKSWCVYNIINNKGNIINNKGKQRLTKNLLGITKMQKLDSRF